MELNNENELPKSRCEILKWARIHFNLTPAVNDIITKAANNIGTIEIKCSDKKLNTFYQSLVNNTKFNLASFIHSIALSYFKFGEAIPYGKLVDKDGQYTWDKFILLEPELVVVETDFLSPDKKFSLILPEELIQQVKEGIITASKVVEAVNAGTNLNLKERDISLLARFTDPSATRGTSPIQSLFRELIYLEELRGKKMTTSVRDEMNSTSNRIRTSLELKTLGSLPQVRHAISQWLEHKFFKPIMKLNNMTTPPIITWKLPENKETNVS